MHRPWGRERVVDQRGFGYSSYSDTSSPFDPEELGILQQYSAAAVSKCNPLPPPRTPPRPEKASPPAPATPDRFQGLTAATLAAQDAALAQRPASLQAALAALDASFENAAAVRQKSAVEAERRSPSCRSRAEGVGAHCSFRTRPSRLYVYAWPCRRVRLGSGRISAAELAGAPAQ